METTIYLVRHAQAQPSPHQLEADWDLSATGQAQASGLAAILTAFGIQRLYSSPYLRCRNTLKPFGATLGLEVVLHDGLRERKIAGKWMTDLRDPWRRSWEDFSYACDGGESSYACQERMSAAVTEIALRHPGETIGLGSHGNAIGLFMNFVAPDFGFEEASRLRTPELLRVRHGTGGFRWDRTFGPGATFDKLATDFRLTPGIIA